MTSSCVNFLWLNSAVDKVADRHGEMNLHPPAPSILKLGKVIFGALRTLLICSHLFVGITNLHLLLLIPRAEV